MTALELTAPLVVGKRRRANRTLRWRAMIRVGLRMMVHDKLKMIGTLVGVVFAVLLSNQQAGTLIGLLKKNTMFIENSQADIWVVPPNTEQLAPGKSIPEAIAVQARGIAGVAWAEPLLFGGGQVAVPGGSSEAVTVIGTKLPGLRGGPWNMVAGTPEVLAQRRHHDLRGRGQGHAGRAQPGQRAGGQRAQRAGRRLHLGPAPLRAGVRLRRLRSGAAAPQGRRRTAPTSSSSASRPGRA